MAGRSAPAADSAQPGTKQRPAHFSVIAMAQSQNVKSEFADAGALARWGAVIALLLAATVVGVFQTA